MASFERMFEDSFPCGVGAEMTCLQLQLREEAGDAGMSKRRRPTAVSLFCGAGGIDIGLERAGFQVVAASDVDHDCMATLRVNQGSAAIGEGARSYLEGARLVQCPIEGLTAEDLRPEGVASDWAPDLLAGGPPCQPFSSAGLMASLRDPRGMLFVHFVRLARELRPRTILFENVRGLVTARGPHGVPGEALHIVKQSFEEIGYATTFALLNAADFGLPQRRVRLFMLASRCTELPVFPEPTHAMVKSASIELEAWVSLGEFLRGRPEPHKDDVVRPSPELGRQLEQLGPGKGLKSPGKKEATRPGGHWGYKQGTFIADPSLPARTVTTTATQDWIRLGDGLRRLTFDEVKGLQAFPDAWRFVGSKASRFRQVGNAVPSLVAELLGESLLSALSGPGQAKPWSAPLPEKFVAAIAYTMREQRRNGESRAAAKAVLDLAASVG